MHFYKAVVGAFALATSVAAQLAFTSAPTNVEEGVPVTFTYTASDLSAPATISLLEGDSSNLATILVITSSATGGSYTWVPPADLVSNTDYAFSISQGSATNYWGPVVLNSGLEPSGSAPAPAPPATTPAPPASTPALTSIYSSPPPITVTTVPVPANTTVPAPPPVVTPPTNGTIPPVVPTPTPISGAHALGVSITGLAALFGSFLFFL